MSISPAFRRLLARLALVPLTATALVVSTSPASVAAPAPPPVPSTGAYIGSSASTRSGENAQDAILRTEAQMGRKLAIDHQFYKWNVTLPTAHQTWDINGGRIPFVSWKPVRTDGTAVTWTRINTGAEDAWIAAQADRVRNFGHPLFMVFHHEPYDESTSGFGTPAEFQAAFRRVVTIFRQHGATNVGWTMVLTSWDYTMNRGPAFYPGADYVDWVAADPYNWFKRDGKWTTLKEVTADFYNWGSTTGKPLMLAEWGSEEDPNVAGRKAQWFNDAAAALKAWPNIKAAVYFNNYHDVYNWAIDTSTSALQAYKTLGLDPWFSPMLGSTTPPPPPPAPVPPTATITQPAQGATYDAGTTVAFAGTGTSSNGQPVAASGHSWKVELHHDGVVDTVKTVAGTTSGSFTVPAQQALVPNLFYRIALTVTDAGGSSTVTRDVAPRLATLTVESDPTGLQIMVDGTPVSTPSSTTVISGSAHTLSAPASQTAGGATWDLTGWTDGGTAQRTVTPSAPGATYRATYQQRTVAPPPAPNGTGLTGTYFDQSNLTAPKLTRVDPVVNFDWGKSAPVSGMGADTFSVRWTGSVYVPSSETYTFSTRADDGARLWVDGKLVINNWVTQPLTETSGSITLTGGQHHDITLEYFDNKGRAAIQLLWASPSTPKALIPQSRLFPTSTGILSDDFSGGLAQWSGATNLSVDTTRGPVTADRPSVRAAVTGAEAFAYRNFPTTATAVCAGVDVLVASVGADPVSLMKLRSASGVSIGRVSIFPNGTIGVRADVTGTVFPSTTALSLGVWHEVRLCGDVPGDSWELWLDGARVGSWSADNGTTPFGRVQIGDNDPKTFTMNLDNLHITG